MKELSYWEQFLKSGTIEDYLKFKHENESKALKNAYAEKNAYEVNAYEEKNPYAGVCNSNRDDYKDSAYR